MTIDDLGRIAIPSKRRKFLGWGKGDKLMITLDCEGKTLVIAPIKETSPDAPSSSPTFRSVIWPDKSD